MRAIWNNQVIAEADRQELIRIEGNWYFPPDSVKRELYTTSGEHTICHWKGEASYYDISVDSEVNRGGAWYYPEPTKSSIKIVGKDYSNYVAFWRGVEVKE